MPTREQLQGWITASQRTQRRVVTGAVVFAGLAIVVKYTLLPGLISTVALLTAITVGVCGFWVTAAHISDWRTRLNKP